MKNSIFIVIMSVIMTGCFATMPDPVKDEFLVDQTAEETQKMDSIAEVIISKRKEKDVIEEKIKVTKQQIVIAKKKLPVLKNERKVLLEKQKLYTIENNEAMLIEVNGEIEKNDKQQEQQKAYIKYLEALLDDQKATMELKHAELAVKVAELNVEKAQIARRYQEKNFLPPDKDEKDEDAKKNESKNFINVKTYEDYYVKQQELLKKKKEKKQKSTGELNKAKETLTATGYSDKSM